MKKEIILLLSIMLFASVQIVSAETNLPAQTEKVTFSDSFPTEPDFYEGIVESDIVTKIPAATYNNINVSAESDSFRCTVRSLELQKVTAHDNYAAIMFDKEPEQEAQALSCYINVENYTSEPLDFDVSAVKVIANDGDPQQIRHSLSDETVCPIPGNEITDAYFVFLLDRDADEVTELQFIFPYGDEEFEISIDLSEYKAVSPDSTAEGD